MKVVYLLNIFPKISETFILNEIRVVQKKGISVKVFAYADPKEMFVHPKVREIKSVTYFFKANIFQVLFAHLYWLLRSPAGYFRAAGLVLRHGDRIRKLFLIHLYDTVLVHRSKPDHLHAHFGESLGDIASANLAMVLHVLSGTPYTFTTYAHDIFDMPATNYPIKSKLAKKHITVSEYNKRFLVEKFGVAENDIQVVVSGIDFEQVAACAKKADPTLPAGKRTILCIARLSKEKGLDVLVQACKRLVDSATEFQCVIVGDGVERQRLETLIRRTGLSEKVLLVGYQSQPQVFEWFNKADVMVLPSYSEGIPLSLMEAMAFRVPVVASDICGNPELIKSGENGFLMPAGDDGGFAERIKEILENEGLRDAFVKKGYETVYREFNLDTQVDKLLAIWKA